MIPKYAYPEPPMPFQVKLLAPLSLVGMAALWLAAFEAFQTIAPPLQAALAATLIETGASIEAFAYITYKKWYYLIGLSIMAVVSGIYNYTQATQAAINSLELYQLLALALGPLASSVFVAFAFGHAYNEYRITVTKWEKSKADWDADKQAEAEAEAEARRTTELSRRQRIEDEERVAKEAAKVEARRIAEDERLYRQATEEKRIAEEIIAKEAERKRVARREAKDRKLKQQSEALPESVPVTTGSGAEVVKPLPEPLPEWIKEKPKNIAHFRLLVSSGKVNPFADGATGSALGLLAGVSDKSGRNWLAEGKEIFNANKNKNGKVVMNNGH